VAVPAGRGVAVRLGVIVGVRSAHCGLPIEAVSV
jgi:hypothetical protein